MSEIKLQSDIVRKFSELYPEKRGQLFHVPNERNHALQAIQAKGIGIFPGVSDLMFVDGITAKQKSVLIEILNSNISDKEISLKIFNSILEHFMISKVVLLELKYPGRSHEVWHVKQQLEWAKTMTCIGHEWRLITNVEDAIDCTNHNYKGLSIQEVEQKIKDNGTKKRIKF